MSSGKFKTIDDYIASFPKNTQTVLRNLRKTIMDVGPTLVEGISYSIPTFYLNSKYLIYFAGFKKHVSVYPAITEAVQKADLKDFKVSIGTLKFPLDEPIPYGKIAKFVKFRIKEAKIAEVNNKTDN